MISDIRDPKINAYFEALEIWNRALRLTGAKDKQSLIDRHLDDAVCLAKHIPQRSTILDIGSGGGLPGIPFAILRPDCTIHLVEPIAKKCAFLRSQSYQLGLTHCHIHRARLDIDQLDTIDVETNAQHTDSMNESALDYLEQSDAPVPLHAINIIWSLATFSPTDWATYGAKLQQHFSNITTQVTFINTPADGSAITPPHDTVITYANKRKALLIHHFG